LFNLHHLILPAIIMIMEFWQVINLEQVGKILGIIVIFLVLYIVLSRVLQFLKREFLKKAKTKKERSNVEILFRTSQYLLIFFLLVFGFLAYGGSLTGIGVVAGLISAALGWALQRPITGTAAWLMLIIKRPFEIGDRVIIGDIKGDVCDITLTHLHIKEIGGTITSEEPSGRVVLIPNARLFEENIINYTYTNELILDQVKFIVTHESNLNKVKKIAISSTKKVLSRYMNKPKEPYIRVYFQSNGMGIHTRYVCPAEKREEIASEITQEIFAKISSSKEVNFAYQHQDVLLRKK